MPCNYDWVLRSIDSNGLVFREVENKIISSDGGLQAVTVTDRHKGYVVIMRGFDLAVVAFASVRHYLGKGYWIYGCYCIHFAGDFDDSPQTCSIDIRRAQRRISKLFLGRISEETSSGSKMLC